MRSETSGNWFVRRPWLLVVAAFLMLVVVWMTVIHLSGRIPTHELNAEEEAALIRTGGVRP